MIEGDSELTKDWNKDESNLEDSGFTMSAFLEESIDIDIAKSREVCVIYLLLTQETVPDIHSVQDLPLDIIVPMSCRYPIVEFKLPQNVLSQSIWQDIEFMGERNRV